MKRWTNIAEDAWARSDRAGEAVILRERDTLAAQVAGLREAVREYADDLLRSKQLNAVENDVQDEIDKEAEAKADELIALLAASAPQKPTPATLADRGCVRGRGGLRRG